MKYTKLLSILFFLFLFGCREIDIADSYYPYKFIKNFSTALKKETGLVLSCYGAHLNCSEEMIERYGKEKFGISYDLFKTQEDVFSIDEVRCLIVSICESFMKRSNADPELMKHMHMIPLTYDWMKLSINFIDKNKVFLGNGGVSKVFFWQGKIKYKNFKIIGYKGSDPEWGQSSVIHEETYEEALEIVKQQGCLRDF